MLPRPRKVVHVYGRPVEVGPPNPTPTADEVERVARAYVAEVRRIFEKHKHECLPPEVAGKGLIVSRL